MIRRVIALLAVVGVTVAIALSQSGNAFVSPPDGERNACEEEVRRDMNLPLYGGKYSGGNNFDGKHSDNKHSGGGLSNEAEQCNGTLHQKAKNKPVAVVVPVNANVVPQLTLVGDNHQANKQSNNTWIDQSQHVKAAQVNAAFQNIWDGGGAAGPNAFRGGGGAPLSNEADQSNHELEQKATNKPLAAVVPINANVAPQLTLVGDNYQVNKQSNNTWIDQSQQAKAAQVNVAGQSIEQQPAPPIDPTNDADQSNGSLEQKATNKPLAAAVPINANVAPQVTLVGDNHQFNGQSNNTGIDQSQDAGAFQGNFAGQLIQQG